MTLAILGFTLITATFISTAIVANTATLSSDYPLLVGPPIVVALFATGALMIGVGLT